MANDDFDIFNKEDKKGQSMKATDITGERFYFHSLPKEFQDLHTNDYILEQRGELDPNKTSKAVLNGYMWQTIGDASSFGIITALAIIAGVVKLKLSPDIWGLLLTLGIFIPWVIYVMYHFTFYAFIRAQIVGQVTGIIADKTTFTFYRMFILIIISLNIAFLVFCSFLEDIAILFANLAKHGSEMNSGINFLGFSSQEFFILIHNFIADFINGPEDLFGKILANEWLMTIVLSALLFIPVYLFEKNKYNSRLEEVTVELKRVKTTSGYPIESALDCLWNWRKENGV